MELSPRNLILINANIITLDPFCPQASWVAIENDKIVALGDGKGWKNLRDKNTGILDCSGKTVIPGLIDAHLHLVSYAKSLVTLDLSPGKNVQSISDIQSIIKNSSRNRPSGQWILGRGYRQEAKGNPAPIQRSDGLNFQSQSESDKSHQDGNQAHAGERFFFGYYPLIRFQAAVIGPMICRVSPERRPASYLHNLLEKKKSERCR